VAAASLPVDKRDTNVSKRHNCAGGAIGVGFRICISFGLDIEPCRTNVPVCTRKNKTVVSGMSSFGLTSFSYFLQCRRNAANTLKYIFVN
jgi:hypothetical protein